MNKVNDRYFLSEGDTLDTLDPHESYWLERGKVQIFIVPAIQSEKAERDLSLCTVSVDNNHTIPAFYYHDPSLSAASNDRINCWYFRLQALEDDTELSIRAVNTKVLKKNFLKHFAITAVDGDYAFENSLIQYFNSRQMPPPPAGENTIPGLIDTIENIFSNDGDTPKRADSHLYKAVQFGARMCGVPQNEIKDETAVRSELNNGEMTPHAIAQLSGFICRDVALDENWYTNDCGVIVTNFIETKTDDQGKIKTISTPVTCYRKGNRYYLYNSKQDTKVPLTRELAESLSYSGWSLRRALPQKPVDRKELLQFMKKSLYTHELVQLFILSVLTTLIGILLPMLNQMIYDDFIPLGNHSRVMELGALIAACMIGNIFITIVKNLQAYRIPSRIGYELQDALYHRVFSLSTSMLSKYESADLAIRISSVGNIVNMLAGSALTTSFTLAVSVFYWIQMGTYSVKLMLIALVMILLYCGILLPLSLVTLKPQREASELSGQASGILNQLIGGIQTLRLAGVENRAIYQYSQPVAKQQRILITNSRFLSLLNVLRMNAGTIFSVVLYYLMIKADLKITMGAFIAFTTAFSVATGALTDAVQAITQYVGVKPDIERFMPFLKAVPEDAEDGGNKLLVNKLEGRIDIDHVSFSYDSSLQPVLDDVSLHIGKGEYVGIVGPSGSGKTTLFKLLLGFEKPNAGHISYDGMDIAALNKHSLRRKLGVVLQDGKLIAGSIYENITITAAHPSKKEAWKVLEDVNMAEDVKAMGMNIDTMVNEEGYGISGGQRQRILIARAIYNNPAILLLDEATSALDNKTQAQVCQSLEKRKMTRVAIAHRISTVQHCDRILVMDKGRIVEEGTFETLIAKRGLFYEMACIDSENEE